MTTVLTLGSVRVCVCICDLYNGHPCLNWEVIEKFCMSIIVSFLFFSKRFKMPISQWRVGNFFLLCMKQSTLPHADFQRQYNTSFLNTWKKAFWPILINQSSESVKRPLLRRNPLWAKMCLVTNLVSFPHSTFLVLFFV